MPDIRIETPAGPTDAYLSKPAAGGRAGVVVIQEWWGLVPHIRDVADRLAAAGYVALAPDLYEGKRTVDAEEAEHLMQGLDWGKARLRLAAAVRHLRTKESCAKVGVTGFCMGGALTILAAVDAGTAEPDSQIEAYAAFYGFPGVPETELAKIAAPGRVFFGEQEGFFDVPAAQRFADAQKARGLDTELRVYPGAGHGFHNDTRPGVYVESAAKDAWKRTLELFERTLAV